MRPYPSCLCGLLTIHKDRGLAINVSQERRHNTLCLLYGSDPTRYAHLVGGNGLHPARVTSCRHEFKTYSRAWAKLLMPHSVPPPEIARKRCAIAMQAALALMRATGTAADVLKEAQNGLEKEISACTAAYLKAPKETQKTVLCMRYATTVAEARACRK